MSLLGSYAQSFSSIEYRLATVVSNFKDGEECSALIETTSILSEDIEEELYSLTLTTNQESQLKRLQKETSAVEKFIATVGGCRRDMISMEDLQLANQRINASVSQVFSRKYCVDFIRVEAGEQVAYLAYNNRSKAIKLDYKWKNHIASFTGAGNMGIIAHHMRNAFDNQSNRQVKSISFSNVDCIGI